MRQRGNKILLTGATGQLGKEILKILGKKFNVCAPTRKELDLEKTDEIYRYCSKNEPDILILAGAYTDVDGSELEKEKVFKINFLSTKEFVKYVAIKNKMLIFISSDYVFDGKKETYSEIDLPQPLCFYGKTKYLAEKEIISNLKKYFIIRTSWLYGEGKNNFIFKFLEKAKTEKNIKVVIDRYGSPTYTKDVALALITLIYSEKYGIYHIVNTGRVSRFEFAEKIKNLKKLSVKITPVRAEEFGEMAKRPFSSALTNIKFSSNFYPLRDWKEALKEFLNGKFYENWR